LVLPAAAKIPTATRYQVYRFRFPPGGTVPNQIKNLSQNGDWATAKERFVMVLGWVLSPEETDKVGKSHLPTFPPGAYRVFWCYGPEKQHITLIAVTPHP
jgi:hypothetical protein